MAEENNSEDLSMEDILSSIKNILSEDGAVAPDTNDKPKEMPSPAVAASDVSPVAAETEVEFEEVDDEPEEEILDLSPEMRVDEDAEISLDDITLDGVALDAPAALDVPAADSDALTAEPVLEPVAEDVSAEIEMPKAEPFLETSAEPDLAVESFDDKSDPFFEDTLSDTSLNLDDINLETLGDIVVPEAEGSTDADIDIQLPAGDDFNLEDINSEIASVLGEIEEPAAPAAEAEMPEIVAEPAAEEPLVSDDALLDEPGLQDVSDTLEVSAALDAPAAQDVSAEPVVLNEPEVSVVQDVAIESDTPAAQEEVAPVSEAAFAEPAVVEDINLGTLEGFEETPNIFNQEIAAAEEVVEPEVSPIPSFIVENANETIDALLEHEILPPASEVEILEPLKLDAEPVAEKVENKEEAETVDVSASIINNFAKILSKSDDKAAPSEIASVDEVEDEAVYNFESAKTQETERNLVIDLGEGNKTLSDIIHDVVRQIIGKEVARSWNLSLDYDDIVRQELRTWLDNNLPAMVEDLVKKEIRRVMVKVGDN